MIYLRLFFEFFKVGLFSVGGGLATIPFLTDLGQRTGWFTSGQLADMIAISESTPGPLGVNMSTYVGFHTAGLLGSIVSTLGLVTPSILVILLIARILKQFRQSRVVNAIFYGLRAASVALITVALLEVAVIALPISCSIGVALAPEDGWDYRTLCMAADRRAYRAKAQGKNRFLL